MESLINLSVPQIIAIGVILIAIVISILYFLKNVKLKKGDLELNAEHSECRHTTIDAVLNIKNQMESDFRIRYAGYLNNQKRVYSSYFSDIIPISWKFVVAECIYNSLMSAIQRNHIAEKLTNKDAFSTWAKQLDFDALQDFKSYITAAKMESFEWTNYVFNSPEFASVISQIRAESYFTMRRYFIDMIRNTMQTISTFDNLDEKSKTELAEMQKLLKKIKDGYQMMKDVLENYE